MIEKFVKTLAIVLVLSLILSIILSENKTEAAASTYSAYFSNNPGTGSRTLGSQRKAYINVNNNSAINFGAGDFTIEFWMRSDSVNRGIAGCSGGADVFTNGALIIDRDVWGSSDPLNGDFGISLMNDGRLAFSVHNGQNGVTACSNALAANTWYFISAVKQGNSIRIFRNGNQEGSATLTGSSDLSYSVNRDTSGCGSSPCQDPFLVFGAEKHAYSESYDYRGYLDEIRISNNARYGSNFSAPTSILPVDGNTIAMYRFENNTSDSSGNGFNATNQNVTFSSSIVPPLSGSTPIPTPTITPTPTVTSTQPQPSLTSTQTQPSPTSTQSQPSPTSSMNPTSPSSTTGSTPTSTSTQNSPTNNGSSTTTITPTNEPLPSPTIAITPTGTQVIVNGYAFNDKNKDGFKSSDEELLGNVNIEVKIGEAIYQIKSNSDGVWYYLLSEKTNVIVTVKQEGFSEASLNISAEDLDKVQFLPLQKINNEIKADNSNNTGNIIGIVVAAVLLLACLILAFFMYRKGYFKELFRKNSQPTSYDK